MLIPDIHNLFPLDGSNTYLDHGGFGVTPLAVTKAALQWRENIERNPRKFFDVDYPGAWEKTAAFVAKRFLAQEGDVALIENTTDGINAILRSQSFQPNDEILILSLAYGAVALATKCIAKRHNVRLIEAKIPYPVLNSQQCLDAIKSAITPQTRLAIFDHITSKTALLLPIAEMTRICRDHGIAVIVDGAHAPGQIALDIPAIGADWYVGNLHKWYFAQRGCGFIWARSDRQDGLLPTALSWEIEKPFPMSFSWTGTRDASSWLSLPTVFKFIDQFGEENILQHNHALIRQGIRILTDAWGVNSETPDSMIGSMSLIPLPEDIRFPITEQARLDLFGTLTSTFKVTCPCILQGEQLFLRVSAQIYNKVEDYELLADAINSIRGNLSSRNM